MLGQTAHRPWPMPRRPWVMHMRWHDLLFMHWPVPASALRPLIPAGLELETFDGMAWLGIVPFRMSGVRPRYIPPLPWLSAFPELNVRTYVSAGGKPGVWFFSLDAANLLAVRGARLLFHLPYYDADMRIKQREGTFDYLSLRTHSRAPGACLELRYRPTGPAWNAAPGSLDHWLTERYCLYSAGRCGRIYRCEIQHPPWPLQPAEAQISLNTMAGQLGLALPETQPLLHFARYQPVVAWMLERSTINVKTGDSGA